MDGLLKILVGLALVLFGLEGPLIAFFGAETTAQVESVAPQSGNDGLSVKDWTVTYRFRTASARIVSGALTRSQVYNTSTLPREGSALTIRYIPAVPFINRPTDQTQPTVAHLGLVALGTTLMVMGSWQCSRVSRQQRA